eukprot:10486866-Heterocapsa_arctica.AAC.2
MEVEKEPGETAEYNEFYDKPPEQHRETLQGRIKQFRDQAEESSSKRRKLAIDPAPAAEM